ncbi:porin family protein [Desulfopila inferna]|uniref:porin family protein n=1 Tax=Desulfopila inferna TaxID=468528 RepID=UPI001965182F|nr:porin family protein [Desulfopila inferna]MBM9603454.1 porin family protein [Desulfopila inferna]
MRKHLVFTAVVLVIFFSASAYAQNPERFYIGAGGSYAVENFDGGDYDNSWGANLKFGYKLHPLFDLELNLDYLDEFEDSLNDFQVAGMNVSGDASLEVTTFMFVMKGYFPLNHENVKLSVVVGGGIMNADLDSEVRIDQYAYAESFDDSDFAWKVGLGADVFVSREVSLGIEGNYTMGTGDLDGIEYFNFTLGVAYHF